MLGKITAKQRDLFFKYRIWGLSIFCCFEANAKAQSIGSVAATVTSSFGQIAQLITAGSYIAGLAFSIGAIMKFKQHKDNPTQVPVGTPIALLFIAAALLFLPSILGVTGETLFGGGSVAGASGVAWKPS